MMSDRADKGNRSPWQIMYRHLNETQIAGNCGKAGRNDAVGPDCAVCQLSVVRGPSGSGREWKRRRQIERGERPAGPFHLGEGCCRPFRFVRREARYIRLKGGQISAQGNALGLAHKNTRVALKGRKPRHAIVERTPKDTDQFNEKKGLRMPQSLAKLLVHLIFSTKNRAALIQKPVRPELYKYMNGILDGWDSPAIIIGSVEDHIHLLFCLSKNHALSKVVEHVKKGSSKWIKTQGARYATFQWQAGYGAFSVSQSNAPRVKTYIENQEEHHRRRTFQDEFRAFLRRHQVEFDERYVWD